jgi:hypothetical protein
VVGRQLPHLNGKGKREVDSRYYDHQVHTSDQRLSLKRPQSEQIWAS